VESHSACQAVLASRPTPETSDQPLPVALCHLDDPDSRSSWNQVVAGVDWLRTETIAVPGATRSGLIRPSGFGPRLLKAAICPGSSAMRSVSSSRSQGPTSAPAGVTTVG
jgi:hypothetical protein